MSVNQNYKHQMGTNQKERKIRLIYSNCITIYYLEKVSQFIRRLILEQMGGISVHGKKPAIVTCMHSPKELSFGKQEICEFWMYLIFQNLPEI